MLLTGTPLQNSIEELFSLLNFLHPQQFNSSSNLSLEVLDKWGNILVEFLEQFGQCKTEEQVTKLQEILKPMMLRRLKEDVEKSLIPKEETIIEVQLSDVQKKFYRAILERNFTHLCKGIKFFKLKVYNFDSRHFRSITYERDDGIEKMLQSSVPDQRR